MQTIYTAHGRAALILVCSFLATMAYASPKQVKNITYGPKGTVLLFVASQCPCTDAHRIMINKLLARADEGVTYYCVFPNSGESKDRIEHFFKAIGWDMPYVRDSGCRLADLYGVNRTPTAVLTGPQRQLLYRGPIDDGPRNLGQIEHAYLSDSVSLLSEGELLAFREVPPMGCWIVRDSDSKRNP